MKKKFVAYMIQKNNMLCCGMSKEMCATAFCGKSRNTWVDEFWGLKLEGEA